MMKKYFIQYPLYPVCNMKCAYCLHGRWRLIDAKPEYEWSIDQYRAWRDTCLEPEANLVIHLASGEPSFGANKRPVERLFAETDRERFDILTNGTCQVPNLWIKNRHRIDRIGATFHRRTITQSQGLEFYSNIMKMRDAGLPVYVKELAFRSTFHETLRAKDQWEKQGIPFKIQHYRKMNCEHDDDGEIDEILMKHIDSEYMSYDFASDRCFCRKGYEGIILRFDGRILTCWHNQKVIGSIKERTYRCGSVTYKYVSKSGEAKCRVCEAGKPFDATLGPTLGQLYNQINREGQGMNAPEKGIVEVPISTILFSHKRRLEDAVGLIGGLFNELAEVIEAQDKRIAELNIRAEEKGLEGPKPLIPAGLKKA